jgi:hypothetical protein
MHKNKVIQGLKGQVNDQETSVLRILLESQMKLYIKNAHLLSLQVRRCTLQHET